MPRKTFQVDVSSVLTRWPLEIAQLMGARAKSVVISYIPPGVTVKGDWSGELEDLHQGDVIADENLERIYLTTTGSSALTLRIVCSTSNTFWPFSGLLFIGQYQATPGTMSDGQYGPMQLDATGRVQTAPALPTAKGSRWNTALPAANADLLADAITPTNSPSYLRVFACFSVSGILSVKRTKSAVTSAEQLNSGLALTANAMYQFDIEYETGDSINFGYSVTSGTIVMLRALEVTSP